MILDILCLVSDFSIINTYMSRNDNSNIWFVIKSINLLDYNKLSKSLRKYLKKNSDTFIDLDSIPKGILVNYNNEIITTNLFQYIIDSIKNHKRQYKIPLVKNTSLSEIEYNRCKYMAHCYRWFKDIGIGSNTTLSNISARVGFNI